MIRYTGHPFVDVGVAVIENYIQKPCEELTDNDLENTAKWLKNLYKRKDLKGYLTVHFPNSGWCNATISQENRENYITKVLESYNAEPFSPERACSFCNHPAQFLADRQHIPMLTGMTLLVTAPYGVTGLPVCGYCLYAVQFYPLATVKVQGKPLFWWTPNPDLTYKLVAESHSQVMQLLSGTDDKFQNLNWHRTRLMETAKKVIEMHSETDNLSDCFGYHVTNYGSGPDFSEYLIPKALLEFWREVRFRSEEVRNAHNWIIESQWEKPKMKKGKNNQDEKSIEATNKIGGRRNYYYEDLSRAFDSRDWDFKVKALISKYHLILQPGYLSLNCFELAELFLRKVGGMDRQRIETIKKVADKVTDKLILGNNEKRWFTDLFLKQKRMGEFLTYMIKAQKRLSDLGEPLSLDDILVMLDLSSKEDVSSKDYWLVRDLFLIRMLELLGQKNHEVLKEVDLDVDLGVEDAN